MDKFLIRGGKPLHGTVAISGAKNSALPVMAAALLTAEPVTLHNIPKVRDLITMSKLLAFMSATVSTSDFPASDYTICAPTLNHAEAPYDLVKTMRASSLVLGPLVARCGRARVSVPGGCAIGARPINPAGHDQLVTITGYVFAYLHKVVGLVGRLNPVFPWPATPNLAPSLCFFWPGVSPGSEDRQARRPTPS